MPKRGETEPKLRVDGIQNTIFIIHPLAMEATSSVPKVV